MSASVPTPLPNPSSKKTQQSANDSLLSPQFVLAVFAMMIVAGTVAAVFWRQNDSAINVALGFVFGSLGSGVIGFYFGSSKGSQNKDALIATETIPPVGTTTTTVTPVTTTTVTPTTTVTGSTP